MNRIEINRPLSTTEEETTSGSDPDRRSTEGLSSGGSPTLYLRRTETSPHKRDYRIGEPHRLSMKSR